MSRAGLLAFAVEPQDRPGGDKEQDSSIEAIASLFGRFGPTVKTRRDDRWLYIESDGMPDHRLMVGITNWQQQVPLPQPYTGSNAWKIPLHPVLADEPVSARTGLRRGAIALAVNGVPIFNALNNRGEDSYKIGELDEFGGHSGRADDYHYHIAPLHLVDVVGAGRPIAMALDGFPIHGLDEPDGSPVRALDRWNGHLDDRGRYHYHATRTYPYINGGMRGVVEVRGDEITPQPRTTPSRPSTGPLRGARVTGFETRGVGKWSLAYQVGGQTRRIDYEIQGDGKLRYVFDDGRGDTRTETYDRRNSPDRRRPSPPPRRP